MREHFGINQPGLVQLIEEGHHGLVAFVDEEILDLAILDKIALTAAIRQRDPHTAQKHSRIEIPADPARPIHRNLVLRIAIAVGVFLFKSDEDVIQLIPGRRLLQP
ncbi:hypothetical protein D3C77_530300 [compost metagenome]